VVKQVKHKLNARDRATILVSYRTMCKMFHVPFKQRLTPKDIASMTNNELFQAARDLYNNSTVKQAHRLAIKAGVVARDPVVPEWLTTSIRLWWARLNARIWLKVFHAKKALGLLRTADRV
jgi:hypothetical protein